MILGRKSPAGFVPAARVAPDSATDAGVMGQMAMAGEYLYVCVADNTWRRVALSTW